MFCLNCYNQRTDKDARLNNTLAVTGGGILYLSVKRGNAARVFDFVNCTKSNREETEWKIVKCLQ